MSKDKKLFRSKDFYLCATLLAAGFPLKTLEPTTGKFSIFVFDCPKEEAEKVLKSYWDRSLKLPVRDFVDAVSELKTRLGGV